MVDLRFFLSVFVNRKLAFCHAEERSISLRFLTIVTPDMSFLLSRKDKRCDYVMLTKEASHTFPLSRDNRYEFPPSSERQRKRI
jgi:hypothetical protein